MRRTARIAGVALLLAGAFALGLLMTSARDGGADPRAASGLRDRPRDVIDEVRAELVRGYYRDVPPSVLARGSIDELISGLNDPYTDYLSAGEYTTLRTSTATSYSGVGLTVRPGSGALIVKAAPRGPARAAGIRPGDQIVSIDGKRVHRLAFDRSIELMRGREGTTVQLTVERPEEGTLTFTVKRGEIAYRAVRSRMLERSGTRLGYVRVRTFRAGVADDVARRAQALVGRGAKGLVLDVRHNPGGLLSEAVGIVSVFVESGVVCVTDGAHQARRVYDVTGDALLADLPLVVLVDGASASAAEVVAAALRDHDRAVVVGRRTYGKAFVQSVSELSNGGALKFTSAVFLAPGGENLSGRGLTPSVRAFDARRTRADEAVERAAAVLAKTVAS